MKILCCVFCRGELEIVGGMGQLKKVKCLKCGFTNAEQKQQSPEVFVIRKKVNNGE